MKPLCLSYSAVCLKLSFESFVRLRAECKTGFDASVAKFILK